MLTAKNLQAMRALLSLAHCHGSILGTSWHLVLTTLQHLVWILGLKLSTGGSLKAGRNLVESNAVINSVMADLPVLSTMLSRLFESSQYLDDVALHHLINALCKLSQEAMELASSNRVLLYHRVNSNKLNLVSILGTIIVCCCEIVRDRPC